MKYVMILITLMSNVAMANQESCTLGGCKQTKIEQDVNTPARDELKDATIIVRRKDGTEEVMDANTFKVVKRKQQFKVKERVIEKTVICQAPPQPEPEVRTIYKVVKQPVLVREKQRKNIIAVGGAYDYTGLTAEVNGNTGTVYSNRGLVMDLSYYRRQLFDSRAGLGVGINTNGSPRAFVGWEF